MIPPRVVELVPFDALLRTGQDRGTAGDERGVSERLQPRGHVDGPREDADHGVPMAVLVNESFRKVHQPATFRVGRQPLFDDALDLTP